MVFCRSFWGGGDGFLVVVFEVRSPFDGWEEMCGEGGFKNLKNNFESENSECSKNHVKLKLYKLINNNNIFSFLSPQQQHPILFLQKKRHHPREGPHDHERQNRSEIIV